MTHKWGGEHDGESWAIEVSYDRFSDQEPFVVDVWVNFEVEPDRAAGAFLSPEQARELAAALTVNADAAERANRREV